MFTPVLILSLICHKISNSMFFPDFPVTASVLPNKGLLRCWSMSSAIFPTTQKSRSCFYWLHSYNIFPQTTRGWDLLESFCSHQKTMRLSVAFSLTCQFEQQQYSHSVQRAIKPNVSRLLRYYEIGHPCCWLESGEIIWISQSNYISKFLAVKVKIECMNGKIVPLAWFLTVANEHCLILREICLHWVDLSTNKKAKK